MRALYLCLAFLWSDYSLIAGEYTNVWRWSSASTAVGKPTPGPTPTPTPGPAPTPSPLKPGDDCPKCVGGWLGTDGAVKMKCGKCLGDGVVNEGDPILLVTVPKPSKVSKKVAPRTYSVKEMRESGTKVSWNRWPQYNTSSLTGKLYWQGRRGNYDISPSHLAAEHGFNLEWCQTQSYDQRLALHSDAHMKCVDVSKVVFAADETKNVVRSIPLPTQRTIFRAAPSGRVYDSNGNCINCTKPTRRGWFR